MSLDQFLVLISISPDALAKFISDPAGACDDAGLSAGDQQALRAGSAFAVYQRVADGSVSAVPPVSPVHGSK